MDPSPLVPTVVRGPTARSEVRGETRRRFGCSCCRHSEALVEGVPVLDGQQHGLSAHRHREAVEESDLTEHRWPGWLPGIEEAELRHPRRRGPPRAVGRPGPRSVAAPIARVHDDVTIPCRWPRVPLLLSHTRRARPSTVSGRGPSELSQEWAQGEQEAGRPRAPCFLCLLNGGVWLRTGGSHGL